MEHYRKPIQYNKHLESTYYLPGIELGTGHRHELDMAPAVKELRLVGENRHNYSVIPKDFAIRESWAPI